MGRPEPVEELIRFSEERLGGLDILINNAAVGIFRSVAEMSPQEWRTLMRTNLDSLFYCCHYALPVMRRSGGGIGFWIAQALVKGGVRTVICGRSAGALQEAVERLGQSGARFWGRFATWAGPSRWKS